jgi:molybdopterin-guanine dinucleotide biosynthesis protein A
MTFDDFTGYVLAGGKSSRMKTDKAFLPFGDESFLNRAVRTLSVVCGSRVKIVLNQTQTHFIERLPAAIPHIFDCLPNCGAPGGIHAALKDCETKYAIILAVDLPLVTPEAIEKLAKITIATNNYAAIVPRQNDGRLQPLCAVYSIADCLPKLEILMNQSDSASVKDFLNLIAPHFIRQIDLTADTAKDLFFNVNRPDDFCSLGSKFD